MRCYGVATRGIVLGDRGDVDDARAFSDLGARLGEARREG